MGDTQTFNPASINFIATSYGVKEPEGLAPILGFPKERLRAWADGEDVPTNDEAILLLEKTRLPLKWFALRAA